MIINDYARFQAALRRLQFEMVKTLGVFWVLKKIPFLEIKEPWKTLYSRSKKL